MPVLYGDEEPLFFTFIDNKEAFDYGLQKLNDKILKPMTDVERARYYHDNDDKEVLANDIKRQKIKAKKDYYSALLDSIDIEENTEEMHFQKRLRIKKIDTKSQQL